MNVVAISLFGIAFDRVALLMVTSPGGTRAHFGTESADLSLVSPSRSILRTMGFLLAFSVAELLVAGILVVWVMRRADS